MAILDGELQEFLKSGTSTVYIVDKDVLDSGGDSGRSTNASAGITVGVIAILALFACIAFHIAACGKDKKMKKEKKINK